MKTPFDTILRARKRELDQVRIAISSETSRLGELENAGETLRKEMAREYDMAANDWVIPNHAYILRKLSEWNDINSEKRVSADKVETLRGHAAEAYGSMRAIENAAETFRFDVERDRKRAEQQAADEVGSARHIRETHAQRRRLQAGAR